MQQRIAVSTASNQEQGLDSILSPHSFINQFHSPPLEHSMCGRDGGKGREKSERVSEREMLPLLQSWVFMRRHAQRRGDASRSLIRKWGDALEGNCQLGCTSVQCLFLRGSGKTHGRLQELFLSLTLTLYLFSLLPSLSEISGIGAGVGGWSWNTTEGTGWAS